MRRHGFGDISVNLFQTLTSFHMQRVPLIVFIGGTGGTGKSSVAQAIGSLLNNHHILNTEIVIDTLNAMDSVASTAHDTGGSDDFSRIFVEHPTSDVEGSNGSLWLPTSERSTAEDLRSLWRSRCAAVRDVIEHEIDHTLRSGKCLIVEGTLINYSLYEKYVSSPGQAIVLCFQMQTKPDQQRFSTVQWVRSSPIFKPSALPPGLRALPVESLADVLTDRLQLIEEEQRRCIASSSRLNGCVTDVVFDVENGKGVIPEVHDVLVHHIVRELTNRVPSLSKA
jgi:hypothetical protein